MYGRQQELTIDVTLGLAPKSITMSTSTKYIWKLRDHIRWAHRKADLFQQKEVWCHKCNYDEHSKEVSLRMGDRVLVCVTTFKGRHKIQSRQENREYMVEWQPYPNIPVYVIHPINGEVNSCILHRNYLLPISNNLEQEKDENAVGGGGSNEPILVPHVYDALLVNWPNLKLTGRHT